jgi:hypothetical protein
MGSAITFRQCMYMIPLQKLRSLITKIFRNLMKCTIFIPVQLYSVEVFSTFRQEFDVCTLTYYFGICWPQWHLWRPQGRFTERYLLPLFSLILILCQNKTKLFTINSIWFFTSASVEEFQNIPEPISLLDVKYLQHNPDWDEFLCHDLLLSVTQHRIINC